VSDNIYKLMKKNLNEIKKLSYPIESFTDLETMTEADDNQFLYEEGRDNDSEDRFLRGKSHTVEDYVKFAENISQKIFIFTFDARNLENPMTQRLREFSVSNDMTGPRFSSSWPMPETAIDVSIMKSKFPEISRYVEEKISESDEKLEDVIIIFMHVGKKFSTFQIRNPLFLLHDFYHAAEASFDYEDEWNIQDIVLNFCTNLYVEKQKSETLIPPFKNVPMKSTDVYANDFCMEILNERFHSDIADHEGHIFSLAVSRHKDFINLPEVVTGARDKKLEFAYYEGIGPDERSRQLEHILSNFANDIISKLTGKFYFTVL